MRRLYIDKDEIVKNSPNHNDLADA